MQNHQVSSTSQKLIHQVNKDPVETVGLNTTDENPKRSRKPILFILLICSVLVIVALVLWQTRLNSPYQQNTTLQNKSAEVDSVDTSNWQTYQNTAYNYQILYPPALKIFNNAADSGYSQPPANTRSIFFTQAEDNGSYPDRYLDLEAFQLKPSLGNIFTEIPVNIGNLTGWEYQSKDTDMPFSTYVFKLPDQSGYLQSLVSNDPVKKAIALQILKSLSWTSIGTSGEEMIDQNNQTQKINSEKWNRYTSEELGISFNYPDYIVPSVADYGETIQLSGKNPSNEEQVAIDISVGKLNGQTLETVSQHNNDPMLGDIVEDVKKIQVGNVEGYSYTARIENSNVSYDKVYIFLPKGDEEYASIVSQRDIGEKSNLLETEILSSLQLR